MCKKGLSLRLTDGEYAALKLLAKNEIRTVSGWLKARIIMEANKAGIEISKSDSTTDNSQCTNNQSTDSTDYYLFDN